MLRYERLHVSPKTSHPQALEKHFRQIKDHIYVLPEMFFVRPEDG
jgi:hypothetical protein